MTMQEHQLPAPEPQPEAARRARWRKRLRPAGLAGLLIAAALVGVWLYSYLVPPPTPLEARDVDRIVAAAMASATPPPANSALVYQAILPSLVFIQTTGANEAGEEGFGVGSGVVVNASGDILTALHVVIDAREIEVSYADGTRATATIAGADPGNDIAVLQASQPPEVIVPAVLSSARAMNVGDVAYAVGNPLGLAGSMSAGVISGFDRSFTVGKTGQRLQGLIQFDAAVNPGNSGGPLLNRAGQVVGIVTALANPNETASFSGIGFAVPIQTAAAAAGAPDY
jgi:S1-C subfamily serine protease